MNPRVVAEFDDSALMKIFAEAGTGVFPSPTSIENEVASMYHARRIGSAQGLTETYYAISPERKLKHPAVVRIIETARMNLFA